MADDLQPVSVIPGAGSIIERDGSWLEPQSDGSYLRRGGPHGAPSAELRARMRGHVSEKMHVARAILDSEDCTPREHLQALELLAKYGMGQKSEKFDAELIKALALAVGAEIDDSKLLRRIEKRWTKVLREFVTGS